MVDAHVFQSLSLAGQENVGAQFFNEFNSYSCGFMSARVTLMVFSPNYWDAVAQSLAWNQCHKKKILEMLKAKQSQNPNEETILVPFQDLLLAPLGGLVNRFPGELGAKPGANCFQATLVGIEKGFFWNHWFGKEIVRKKNWIYLMYPLMFFYQET